MMGVLVLIVLVFMCMSFANISACPAVTECHCIEQILFCVGGNFTEIPDGIPVDVKHMDIHSGELEAIEAEKFGHFIQLQEMTLDRNQIREVENGTFDQLVELRRISLNENRIRYLMPGIFSNLKNLVYLLLSGNRLTSVEGLFTGLTQLESLNLDNNHIRYISNEVFKDLPKLFDIQMNNNHIKEIQPDTFKHTPALMVLGLGSNPISVLDNVFEHNPNLHYINLTSCMFTTFPAKLSDSLRYIKLGKNNITRILKNETERYSHLVTLIIEENHLEYIENDAFTAMPNLTDVFLFVNNLSHIPGRFPRSVQNIYLDSNAITSIPTDTFQTGTEVRMLSLRSNNIGSFDTAAFKTVNFVRALKLDNNPLRILHDNIFLLVSGLHHLALNSLDIHEIYPNCLLGLNSLQTLEMSRVTINNDRGILGNFLIHVPTLMSLNLAQSPVLADYFLSDMSVMESVTNLTHLNLVENKLTTIPSYLPTSLPYLLKLHLAGNPFNCTEDNFWLQMWYMMDPDLFVDADQVFCHTPSHFKGKLFIDVDLLNYDQNNASKDSMKNNMSDVITTEVYHYDYSEYYDYEANQYYDEDYNFVNEDYYPEFDADNYDFLTLSTVKITKQVHETTTPTVDVTHNPEDVSEETPNLKVKKGTVNFRSAAITIGMAFGVIVIMILIAGTVYCIFLRRNRNVVHHNARQNNGTNDYVFIVSKTETQNETDTKPPRKLTREERGSTTSKASQDVTNDTSLKVYTLEMDK